MTDQLAILRLIESKLAILVTSHDEAVPIEEVRHIIRICQAQEEMLRQGIHTTQVAE